MRSSLIASSNAVVFSYVMYLLGKYEYKLPAMELQQIIKRWVFMATITGFYTNSPESTVERQFADLRDVHTAEEYIKYLDTTIRTRMTDDYFSMTLPNDLSTAAAISPAWFGYLAALNVLGTPMLFSTVPMSQFFILGTSGEKNAIDKHHIFPKNYLTGIGYEDDRDRNQIANFTYIDYQTNIDISDDPPADYAARYREKLGEEAFKLSCKQNAIPDGFEAMPYPEFLEKRRLLMAGIVREAYQKLSL